VKTTPHFEERMRERPYIKREWCERIAREPLEVQKQESDGKLRCWGYVEELGKYLRVIVLEDGETLETAYIDRNYGKRRR
jgi:hypothetical protein